MFSAMLDNGIDFRYKAVGLLNPQPNYAAPGLFAQRRIHPKR